MTTKAENNPQPPALGALAELIIGVLAGVASKGITLPISAVCVRQQLGARDDDETEGSHHLSFIDTLRAIHRESGFSGLFSALPPTIPLALLPSVTLYIHSVLLRILLPARHRAHPPGSATFLIGALSNALATIPLYPLVLVKALSQSGADKGKNKRKVGMMGTLVRIVNREGISGLYKGLEGQLLKGVVQQGVMMLIKQRYVRLFDLLLAQLAFQCRGRCHSSLPGASLKISRRSSSSCHLTIVFHRCQPVMPMRICFHVRHCMKA